MKEKLFGWIAKLRPSEASPNVTAAIPRPCDAATLPLPTSEFEANQRADWWEYDDPFDDLFPTLLTASQIANYSRVTGALYPFDEKHLKGATYEVGISGNVYYWDHDNKKCIVPVTELAGEVVIPPNSITFVETDVEFRLPQYLAVRFNLHIKLVHRGILLGTGPIVDPGFRGRLLIPLHNLTSSPFTIRKGEKIVWIEFTKTLFGRDSARSGYISKPIDFRVFPPNKRWLTAADYLTKSNSGNPIVSSISGFIGSVDTRVKNVESSLRTLKIFAYVGIVLTVVLSLYSSWSLYNSALDIIQSYQGEKNSIKGRVEALEKCQKHPRPEDC